MSKLSEMTLAELRALAKEKKIAGASALRKADLVVALEAAEGAAPQTETARKEAVKAAAAKPEEPKAETVKTEAPKAGKAKAEKSKAEAAEAEKPKAKKAKPEAPKTEETEAKAPKAEVTEPKAEISKAAATKAAAPKAEPLKAEASAQGKSAGTPAESAPEVKSTSSKNKPAESTRIVRTVGNGRAGNPEQTVRRVVGDPAAAGKRDNIAGNRDNAGNNRDNTVSNNSAYNRDNTGNNAGRNREQNRTQGREQAGNADSSDSGIIRRGIFELCSENFGFLRNDNYLSSEHDVYVNPSMVRRYNLTTGDVVEGTLKVLQPNSNEKFVPLHHITKINDQAPEMALRRRRFDRLTPVFPHERLHLEYNGCNVSMRIVDMFSPIGKGQRGMIVSQPKAGKTTLLKQIARSILTNHKSVHMIILLIDERPEEVTDFKEFVQGTDAEVIYSTFDEEPNRHRRVAEMTMERAKRLVEYGEDVVILLDSITRLARAYNLTCVSSGRTLSGGLDPNALFMPKKFFGAARCMKEGGSLTILATALVDTGSRMDDVIYEEFKGTGNMELVLDRDLSERRIFPAIDLPKSSTRREDLLLNSAEQIANSLMRKAFNGKAAEESVEQIINLFTRTRTNAEFMQYMSRMRFQ